MHKSVPTNTRDPVAGQGALPDAAYRVSPLSWKGHPGETCAVDKASARGQRRPC